MHLEETDFKEDADDAVKELDKFIHTEEKVIKIEHKLDDATYGVEYILMHLGSALDDQNLAFSVQELGVIIVRIRDVFGKEGQDIHFVREEKKILGEIKIDSKHGKWKVVRILEIKGEKIEKIVKRLETKLLKEVHGLLLTFLKILEGCEKLTLFHLEPYFQRLEHFGRAYERVFKEMYRKEQALKVK